ncbi:hypothetical protein [Paenibacillus sp. y28]|uniref:hypothetical protein n=1 Tax=Paenibacillus sp. y28 TaxID=3129110 RepID=UPI00301766B4
MSDKKHEFCAAEQIASIVTGQSGKSVRITHYPEFDIIRFSIKGQLRGCSLPSTVLQHLSASEVAEHVRLSLGLAERRKKAFC